MLIMKIFLPILFGAIFLSGCASTSSPSLGLTPLPQHFLIDTQTSNDATKTCEEISTEHQYLSVYKEVLQRALDPRAPVLVREPSHTTTHGTAVRLGDSVFGNSTSTTYGGGSVRVVSNITGRYIQIANSIDRRQQELSHLSNRLGSCKPSGLRSSTITLRDLKTSIENMQTALDREKITFDGYIKMAIAQNETPDEIRRRRSIFDNALLERQSLIDREKAVYETLLHQHRSNFSLAESKAAQVKEWVFKNTP